MHYDPFETATDSLIAPARTAFPIVPDDGGDLPLATKALYVGSGGDLVLTGVDAETDVVFKNVASGTILPIRARAVRTSSTATDLVGLA